MWDLLVEWLGEGFMPHGHCYLWSPLMVWTQVSSNFLIGVAYASIASTLAILVRRIKNIPFAWVWVAFGIFILSCGLTHWFDIVTVWKPIYWGDAFVRVVTAIASVATAILILPMVPRAVALAETAQLSNERKEKLEAAMAELEVAHRDLARRAETSEERFKLLVESMPQLATITDAQGNVTYRNRRWSEYTGRSLDELTTSWRAIHDPEVLPEVERGWRHALATGTAFESESRIRRADGTYRWFLARALPMRDKAGTITSWVSTLTDIHDQRMLRDEAVATARMKDEFLATVSHELRTPLNAILGWSRMLRSPSLPDAKRAKALEAVERNAVAQAQLIDDLLDVSRMISGKMRVDLVPLDPSEAVEAALDAVRPTATAKGIKLEAIVERDPGTVLADPARLQQIVWNLVVNAVKFTPAGGRVAVRVARRGDHVTISVEDTGVGIKPEFEAHLFDRFSQQDGSITRKHGGLGLGLAITKSLVELHNGTITALSDGPGRGATFVVGLPVQAQTAAVRGPTSRRLQASPPRENVNELRGLSVLLVEDEADARELVEAVLGECGAAVTSVADAERGLELLRAKTFDVILSDIGLPGQDGYDFIETVRKTASAANLPAAAITAFARAEDRSRALSSGFQMHVSKPVEPTELVATVAQLARMSGAGVTGRPSSVPAPST